MATEEKHMDTKHITVCAFRKNAYKLKNPSYYARIKVDGKTREIPLNTTSKDVADAWVRLRRDEIKKYNDYITSGEMPPNGLLDKLIAPTPTSGTPKAKTSLRDAVDSWEVYLRRIGRRPATVSIYLRALNRLLDYNDTVDSVDEEYVAKCLAKCDELKSATRKLYSVVMRELCKFLSKEYGISKDVADSYVSVKVQSEEKGFWTMQQIRQIIEHVQCKDPIVEQSYKAYFWFMATTGCRQGEASLIEWDDIRDSMVTIRAENTKTNETRRVPLTMGVMDLIQALPHDGKLVFNHIGKNQPCRFAVLRKANKAANVPLGGLHTFRHSASMYLYSKITDIKVVSQMLGHSAQTAIKYYQQTRESDAVADAVRKAYELEQHLPSLIDKFIESGMF